MTTAFQAAIGGSSTADQLVAVLRSLAESVRSVFGAVPRTSYRRHPSKLRRLGR